MRLSKLAPRIAVAAALALCAASVPARGQVTVLDEGSFSILRDGRRVGREDFSIRTTSGAQESLVLASQANQLLDGRRLSAALAATGDATPVTYQREAREPLERITLEVAGSRGMARTRTPTGDGSAEFPVRERPVLLDPDVAHHIALVRRRATAGRIALLLPRVLRVVRGELVVAGSDTAVVAGRAIPATRLRLEVPEHPEAAREAWFDGAGHLLRVVVPAHRLEFRRDDPPPDVVGGR
jgi:hypothetical protein